MILVIGLVTAFVLLMIFGNRSTRPCRWREARSRAEDGAMFYRCAACGAETLNRGGLPKVCLDPTKGTP
ncbi:hypothetical protein [Anianabacter salinae]|uniref:hypothetical protein n=1 Tax=Anianabacter salinae TaxID=2851023 RepID=UPI00225E4534|nr:hypothetical protein [Anianabacter salinae]MBV0913008.1 hypothetical protein [Anianabacter salinae]